MLAVALQVPYLQSFSQQVFDERILKEEYSKNCIYVELLGIGGLYSVDYEYRFAESLSGRIGFTRWSVPWGLFVVGSFDVVGFPVLVSYLVGSGGHYLEVGGGVLIYSAKLSGSDVFFGSPVNGETSGALGAVSIAYRYQPSRGGLLFRVALTPLTNFSSAKIWGGLSLGVAF